MRVNWNGCTGLGLDNGATRVQLTMWLLATVMRPLHTGYVLQQKLPD
ncbi:hypothetical protein OOK41_07635 [Micromonospora sp. NBC_01655]|nr:hypothetical protein [Micromonospora sp. NBC_01655]MCX4470173.1 hypothetical protein [Micromonospora sp. NBC_01655]